MMSPMTRGCLILPRKTLMILESRMMMPAWMMKMVYGELVV